MLYSLGRYTGIAAPEKWPAGKYMLRVRLAASDESPRERRFIEIGTGKADAADFNVLSSHQVTGTLKEPQTLEIPVEVNASGDRNFAIRDKRPNTREAEYAMFPRGVGQNRHRTASVHLDRLCGTRRTRERCRVIESRRGEDDQRAPRG